MASPSYTYTLTNGTTADASQVMQDLNDILNGVTDGTKDLSISALTCAGTATLNGHVNLGNSSADDLTVTASLASNLVPKTTNAYNLGSADLGMAGVYFGTADTDTARIVSAALSADRTYTLPDAGADASFVMTAGTQTVSGTKTFAGQLIGKGTATNDDAAAGYIGEYLENLRATDSPTPTSGEWTSVDSGNATYNDGNETGITLTAGDWDITGLLHVRTSAGTTVAQVSACFGTAKGNNSAGLAVHNNYMSLFNVTTGTEDPAIPLHTLRVKVANGATATYYLKASAILSAGTTVNFRGTIRARRVR